MGALIYVYAIDRSPPQNFIGNFAFETSNTGEKCTEGEKSLLFFLIIVFLLFQSYYMSATRINFVFSKELILYFPCQNLHGKLCKYVNMRVNVLTVLCF